MTHFLEAVFTWPFAICFIVGMLLQRIYTRQKCAWADTHDPLPDGKRRFVSPIDRMWIAGLLVMVSLGYILMTSSRAYNYSVNVSRRMEECNTEFQRVLRARSDANDDSDRFMAAESDSTARWLVTLADPPASIADLPSGSPEYRAWVKGTIREHLADIKSIQDKRDKAMLYKKEHPLPEAKCGK